MMVRDMAPACGGAMNAARRLLTTVMLILASALLSWSAAAQDVVEYYQLDSVGNVLVVTNAQGAVVEEHDYLPFGEELCGTVPCSAATAGQPRRFTGKERDAETGLDYFGARYLGSRIGRFTSVDPVQTVKANLVDPQRWNRYAYVRNNPFRYVDPDGRAIDVLVDIGFIAYDLFDMGRSAFSGQGVSGTQWLALGADVGGAMIPFAFGGGLAVRAASKADNAIALLKAGDKAGDAAKLGSHGDDAARTFDQARREAFERAGMTDPSTVQFTKVDPKTGTVVEFKGPGGAKVAYDAPHPGTPGAGHGSQHVGWQSAGKRGQGGRRAGTYRMEVRRTGAGLP
jgi:RHS repeat-associated protein